MHHYLVKCILIGDTGVGKSCQLLKMLFRPFDPVHDYTIGVDFGSTTREIQGVKIKVHIWDTAGQEVFRSITRSYYQKTAIVFLVYDITNRHSFYHLPRWVKEVNENAGNDVMVVIVGNQNDREKERQVSEQSGREFAERQGFLFTETSTKTRGDRDLLEFALLPLLEHVKAGNPCDGVQSGIHNDSVPQPSSPNHCCKLL